MRYVARLSGCILFWAIPLSSVDAQEPKNIRIAIYAPITELTEAIYADLQHSEDLSEASLKAIAIELDQPYEIALRERAADFAIVPLEQAVDTEFQTDGFSSLVIQPFNGLNEQSIGSLLSTEYRDYVLAELGHSDLFGLTFASLGMSSLVSSRPIAEASEFKGRKIAILSLDDQSLEVLGAAPLTMAFSEVTAAIAAGAVDTIEVPTLSSAAEYVNQIGNVSVISEYSPQVSAVMVLAEVWADYTESERQALKAAFEELERLSFERAQAQSESTEASLRESEAVHFVDFGELIGEESQQVLRAAWEASYPETSTRVLNLFDAALEEIPFNGPEAPSPDPQDRGEISTPLPKIFFATDREEFPDTLLSTRFGIQQATDVKYRCGEVTWTPDPERSRGTPHSGPIQLVGIVRNAPQCSKFLSDEISKHGDRYLLFIHGYNNLFMTALARTIQIAEDTGWASPIVVWSWPSHGEIGAYLSDDQHIDDSRRRFEEFLVDLNASAGVERMDLLTHSMGGRLGVEALYRFKSKGWDHLGNSVFVAPDVSNNAFSDAIRYAQHTGRTTLYASEHDKALELSSQQWLNDQPRAGQAGFNLIILDRLDTVDASAIDKEWKELNHNHAIEVPEGLQDLTHLLVEDLAPRERGLTKETLRRGSYWVIERDEDLRRQRASD